MTASEEKRGPRRKRRLGKGLSALMSHPVQVSADDISPDIASRVVLGSSKVMGAGDSVRDHDGGVGGQTAVESSVILDDIADSVIYIELDDIGPNPNQPRVDMDVTSLRSLSDSIKFAGVMQPILVRQRVAGGGERSGEAGVNSGGEGEGEGEGGGSGGGDVLLDGKKYEIVAGERRWRAARMAGLDKIPAIVREIDERESAEWAIIENIQREDLNPMEKAEGFLHLMEEYDLTQLQVAERVALDRSSVANLLRLNQLDRDTKDDIRSGRLSQGHGKALLRIAFADNRRRVAEAAILGGWSVRELENRVSMLMDGVPLRHSSRKGGVGQDKPEHIRTLEYELGELLGMKSEIRLGRSRSSGKVIISFNNVSEFEHILERMRESLGVVD